MAPATVKPTSRHSPSPTCRGSRACRHPWAQPKRGRPGPDARPAQVVYQLDGALASSRVSRPALIDPPSWFLLATNALDTAQLPPQEGWAGDTGQVRVARGVRLLTDPEFFASSRSLKQPERITALVLVMTRCLLGYAAVEYHIRKALKDQETTFPHQQGNRMPPPTARGGLHCCLGIHWRGQAGQWPRVLNLTAAHPPRLRLLGQPYMGLSDVTYS